MRIDEQVIQGEFLTQAVEAFIQHTDVITILDHPADLLAVDAGRDEPDGLLDQLFDPGASLTAAPDGMGDCLDAAFTTQVLVERMTHLTLVQAEEDVNSG